MTVCSKTGTLMKEFAFFLFIQKIVHSDNAQYKNSSYNFIGGGIFLCQL
jgi:hypothetical protein